MKIFKKIFVAMLLGVMATQAIGADIDKDLIDAIYKGDLAKVKQLVKFGANVKAKSVVGTPVLDIAISSYAEETAKSKKDTHWEIVKYLIDNGADVNVSSGIVFNEISVFMRAVGMLSLEKIKYLISKGGKVNNDGWSALDFAIGRDWKNSDNKAIAENIEILQYIISQGAEVTNTSIIRLYEKYESVNDNAMIQIVKNLIKANKTNINEC